MNKQEKIDQATWKRFAAEENLTPEQLEKFELYAAFLQEENEKYNLTAITDIPGIVRYHFQDSLVLRKYIDMTKLSALVDVGTGAGFPAVPLKIMFPELPILLIEMNQKRQQFLEQLFEKLGFNDIDIAEYDWRTFLRLTTGELPLFVARASLSTLELSRLFRATSPYKDSLLVYWASESWAPENASIASSVINQWQYGVGGKKRSLVALAREGVNVSPVVLLDSVE